MSYAVKRADLSRAAASSSELPTSAAVLEFVCLFTHDLKRKQKRWQDGKLKYHTFNKRIMVYDDRGGFIGDAHWQGDYDLEEGEELRLDRGSAIVQVSDCVGSREQDLSDMLDRRAKEVEQRRANAAARTPVASGASRAMPRPNGSASSHFQLHHRPLSAIVPSPGAIGRANIPGHSPFEARQAENLAGQRAVVYPERAPADRPPLDRPTPAKRRRVSVSPPSKSGHAQSLFGTKLTLSASVAPMQLARSRALREKTNAQSNCFSSVALESQPGREADADDADMATANDPSSSVEVLGRTVISRLPQDDHVPSPCPQRFMRTSTKAEGVIERVSPSEGASRHGARGLEAARGSEPVGAVPSATSARPLYHSEPSTEYAAESRVWENATSAPEGVVCYELLNSQKSNVEVMEVGEEKASRSSEKVQSRSKAKRGEGPASSEQLQTKPKAQHGVASVASERNPKPKEDDRLASTPDSSGPRTELRIKSRKRRGLLMVSESNRRQQSKTTTSKTRMAEPAANYCHARPSVIGQDVGEEERDSSLSASEGLTRSIKTNIPEEPDSESDLPAPGERAKKRREERLREAAKGGDRAYRLLGANDASNRGSPPAGQSHARPMTTLKAAPLPTTGSKERLALPRNASMRQSSEPATEPAPRITRMARKSVKSREIIGFIPPSDDPPRPAPMAQVTDISVAESTLGVAPALITEHNLEIVPATQATPSALMTTFVSSKRYAADGDEQDSLKTVKPKLVNPATRGKKAAGQKHAAGTAPQTIVPLEPVMQRCLDTVTEETGVKKDVVLPGFTSANGGAWSKHAEDLLGMARPTRTTR